MVQSKTQTELKAVMLNADNTKLFLKDMEEICKKADFKNLVKIFQKYPFKNLKLDDYSVFMEQAKIEQDYWQNNSSEVKIKSVDEYDSKCIACSFGKTVKGYSIKYLKMKDERLPGRIIYEKRFALNFEVKDHELIDFAWCNKFLDKEEMKELLK